MDDKTLRSRLIRLASERPDFRPILLPLLRGTEVRNTRSAMTSSPNGLPSVKKASPLPPDVEKVKKDLAKAQESVEMSEHTVKWAEKFQKTHTPINRDNPAKLADLAKQVTDANASLARAIADRDRLQRSLKDLMAKHGLSSAKAEPARTPDGKIVVDGDIRQNYYKMTDGLEGLRSEIRHSVVTMDDRNLADAMKAIDKAVGLLQVALKPYAWD